MGDSTDGAYLAPNYLGITFDSFRNLKCLIPGPKYLVMTRKNTSLNNTDTLNSVSPFLIKKVIDSTCEGEVELCKKLRNGTILIKTKNITQALKLVNLSSLGQSINVEVTEHNLLNFTKGVIYSNDLRGISNEEILGELKDQKIIAVDKIKKKNGNDLIETGLIIVTFASLSLPENVLIGYEKVRVRPHIPRPLRCNNCFAYGHTSKNCKTCKLCYNCSQPHHINIENKETCYRSKSCVNCNHQNFDNINHAPIDNICPIFLKEKEIQAIITLQKTNRNSAISIYKERHPQQDVTYANVTRSTNNTVISKQAPHNPTSDRPSTSRPQLDYSDITPDKEPSMEITPTTSKTSITILPRSISKRSKQQLKRLISCKTNINTAVQRDIESSDSTSQDMDLH